MHVVTEVVVSHEHDVCALVCVNPFDEGLEDLREGRLLLYLFVGDVMNVDGCLWYGSLRLHKAGEGGAGCGCDSGDVDDLRVKL